MAWVLRIAHDFQNIVSERYVQLCENDRSQHTTHPAENNAVHIEGLYKHIHKYSWTNKAIHNFNKGIKIHFYVHTRFIQIALHSRALSHFV